MHELGLTQSILTILTESALAHGIGRIDKATLVVGRERAVCPEALRFAFALLKGPPLAAGAVLEIEERDGSDLYLDSYEGE